MIEQETLKLLGCGFDSHPGRQYVIVAQRKSVGSPEDESKVVG